MNLLVPFSQAAIARMTLFFVSVQVILVSLECLYHRNIYRTTHLLSWNYIRQTKNIFTANARVEKIFGLLFRYPNILFIITLRLLTAILVLTLSLKNIAFPSAALLLCLLGILVNIRNGYSDNGSDQMINIVLISMSIYFMAGHDALIQALSLFFIASQGVLAYLTAGVYKVIDRNWLNGRYLQDILSTRVFGNRHIKRVLDKGGSYRIASWMLIGWEMLLGLGLFFPTNICIILLCAGVFFHLMTAFVMGFNTFIWAFLSVYPSIYFVNIKLHQ